MLLRLYGCHEAVTGAQNTLDQRLCKRLDVIFDTMDAQRLHQV